MLIYCRDHHCSHHVALNADRWADDVRLSDIEPGFVCTRCGKRGAEVRPDFRADGYRLKLSLGVPSMTTRSNVRPNAKLDVLGASASHRPLAYLKAKWQAVS